MRVQGRRRRKKIKEEKKFGCYEMLPIFAPASVVIAITSDYVSSLYV
jgi:hypothetical protein